jgi:hypothetical protein
MNHVVLTKLSISHFVNQTASRRNELDDHNTKGEP